MQTKRTSFALALACALAISDRVARAHDEPSLAVASLDAALEKSPGDADKLLARAALLRAAGKLDRAALDAGLASMLDPFRHDVWIERALIAKAQGDAALAERELSRVLDAGGGGVVALVARAEIRAQKKRFSEARADYDAAIVKRPDPELYLARGRVDEAMNRLDRAAEGYAEGVQATNAIALRLALVRAERARGKPERALAVLTDAITTQVPKAEWLLLRAEVHDEMGKRTSATRDRAEALAEVDAALRAKPTDLHHTRRAKVLLALGRDEEALKVLHAVVKRSPSYREAAVLIEDAKRKTTKKAP